MAVHIGVPVRCGEMSISDLPLGKVGGQPMNLLEEPLQVECHGPAVFICQIYAPGNTEASCFRYLYVFQCAECKSAFVYRAQLPSNTSGLTEEPKADDWNEETKDTDLLEMLSSSQTQKKSNFALEVYQESSEVTQVINRLYGLDLKNESEVQSLYEMMDLGVEQEVSSEEDEEGMDDLIKEMEKKARAERDVSFDVLKFSSDLEHNECIRYSRGGVPLWYSDSNRPNTQVPPCECGSERTFEFQVLPQVLGFVGNLDLEFGTLLIYTCQADCSITNYTPETILIQSSL